LKERDLSLGHYLHRITRTHIEFIHECPE
jgi:hypothetical protein